ncbi:putative ribonuclease H-like domain-containing protein [Tanacetum coccineum]
MDVLSASSRTCMTIFKARGFVNQPQVLNISYQTKSIRRGAIDKTLFIKRDRKDIMLVQVYVDDIIFGSTKTSMVKEFEKLMQKEFKMSSMGELTFFLGLQVSKVLLDFYNLLTIEAHKALGNDEEGTPVDVLFTDHVTPKVSHMHAVKRIFRYLKHQPKLGLWYPKDSPFHLEAFSDSDYAGDNHDRRSTSGGCQYLGRRLVSWQCKKQTIVAISSTEAEYVAAASLLWHSTLDCQITFCLWFQIYDKIFHIRHLRVTICIVKNPVFHSKTKHIQIRHHFIRDCYDQRLINVVKLYLRGGLLVKYGLWKKIYATLKGRVGFEEMLSEIGRFCYFI